MMKFFGIVFEMLLWGLAGSIAFVFVASILDFLCGNKNQNVTVKKPTSSGSGGANDVAHKHISHSNQIDRAIDAVAARMAQEAHDTAVRDSQWSHDDACRMAHDSHDTAMHDHQAAVDCHDQFSAPPDFGVCNPFF